jgi:D-galactarolactone isomerase
MSQPYEKSEGKNNKPSLHVPEDACDCHMHVYESRFPLSPTALSKPPEAPVEDYEKVQERLGLTRAVVVQPSVYGTDNRCTLEAMAKMGTGARGVVVVDQTVTDAELRKLTDAGVRGIRFHMLGGGVLGWDILEKMASRVNEFGWHVQMQLDGRTLPEYEMVLKRLPCYLVIDHVGKFLEPVTPDHPGFQTLLRLIDRGRCWVKLSAPYEISKSGPPQYEDVGRLAKTLVRAAPERMVWASNWPHPTEPRTHLPNEADLLDLLLHWVEDDMNRSKILTDNPSKLYGF